MSSFSSSPSGQGPRPLPLKLCPPRPTPREVERSSISVLLRQTSANLVLISAPAGYGKSTVMGQWLRPLRARGTPVGWLTVDPTDNDPGRFAFHLQAALAALLGTPRDEHPQAGYAEPSGGRQAHRLLDALATVETPFVLFIDEAEHIDSAEVIATLGHVIDMLGPGQCVVIGTRTQPALALGRLRAQGRLLEIDRERLRFTLDETRHYFETRLASALADADLASLQQRTDGWPAALQLASAALNGAIGIDALLRERGAFTRDMTQYLVEDVLSRLPATQRSFLLQTCLFDGFCVPMCNAVLGRENSAALLHKISRDNLFLLTLEAEVDWYRYHPIFRDFLRAQPGVPQGDEAQALHLRAAHWLAGEGRVMPAIEHALASGDQALAAELMAERAVEMVDTGQSATLCRWFDALPDELLTAHPELAISCTYVLGLERRHEDVARLFGLLAGIAEPGSELSYELTGAQLIDLAWSDQWPQAATLALGCLESCAAAPDRPRGTMLNVAAFELSSRGDYAQALAYLAIAKHAHRDMINGLNYSLSIEGSIDLLQGNVREARQRFESTLSMIVQTGLPFSNASGVAASHLAEALYEQNDLQAVELLLEEYLPVIRAACVPDHLIAAYRMAARTHALRGRAAQAQQTLTELLDLGDARRVPRLAEAARQERLRLALLAGDLAQAEQLLKLIQAGSGAWQPKPGQFPYSADLDDAFICEARLALCRPGSPGTALSKRLQAAVDQAEDAQHLRRALRIRCLLAQALDADRRRSQAVVVMEQVLHLASTKGLIRVLADEPWQLPALLEAMQTRAGINPVHLAALSAAMQPAPTQLRPSRAEESFADTLLSQRERQILSLLSDGHSNKELSRQLYISENTVESHLRRINSKLGVRNRMQAVLKARELGLA